MNAIHIGCLGEKNFKYFATSPSPALGAYWSFRKYRPIGVTENLFCVENTRQNVGRDWLRDFFPRHPLYVYCLLLITSSHFLMTNGDPEELVEGSRRKGQRTGKNIISEHPVCVTFLN